MARVLIFANANSTIYNFRRELLARLVAEDHEVVLVLPSDDRNRVFEDMGCQVIPIKLSRFGKNPLWELASIASFLRIVRRSRPEVLLTYTAKPNIYGGIVSQLQKVPHIATVTGLGAAFQNQGLLQRVSATLQRLAYRKTQMVFFQNEDNRNALRDKRALTNGSEVLPGSGVNLELHKFEAPTSGQGKTSFLTVSRIRQDKGYEELFASIRRISSERDDVEFHIVGWYEEDRYSAELETLEESFPVTLHGEVSQEEVHQIMAASDCLVHPSYHEGMANVLLEAASTGRPSIATDIPGCREAVEHGITGLLCAPRDIGSLHSALSAFASLPKPDRVNMGIAARKKMEAQFDRELVVDRYLQEIEKASASASRM